MMLPEHWRNYATPNRNAVKTLTSDQLRAKAALIGAGITDMYSLKEAEMARDELEERGDAG